MASTISLLKKLVLQKGQQTSIMTGQLRKLSESIPKRTLPIRTNMGIASLAFVGCMALIYYDDQFLTGKNALHEGETLNEYNERLHKEYHAYHDEHKCFTNY